MSRKEEYQEFLKSSAWHWKSEKVLRESHWECDLCGRNATQVHHTTYKLGWNPEWDAVYRGKRVLQPLCQRHHDEQHPPQESTVSLRDLYYQLERSMCRV